MSKFEKPLIVLLLALLMPMVAFSQDYKSQNNKPKKNIVRVSLEPEHNPNAGSHTIRKNEIDPNSMTMLFTQGVEMYLFGEIQQANEHLMAINQAVGGVHAPTLYYLASCKKMLADTVGALDNINKALQIDSANTNYLRLKADILLEQGWNIESVGVLDKIIAQSPWDKESRIYQIISLLFNKQDEQAYHKANEFERLFGYNERVTQAKSQYLIGKQLYSELKEYNREVVKSDPSPSNKMMYARVLAATGSTDLADSLFTEIGELALEKNDDEVLLNVADYWRAKEDPMKMIMTCRPILLNPDFMSKGKIELFRMYFEIGGLPEDVGQLLKECAEITDEVDFVEYYIGYLLYMSRQKEAMVELEKLSERGVLSAEMAFYLTQLYYSQSEPQKAIDTASEALNKYPQNVDLGGLLMQIGNVSGNPKIGLDVAKMLLSNVETDSLRSVVLGLRGDTYYALGKHKASYKSYELALKFNPDNSMVLNNWAYHISLQSKRRSDLERALEMAVKSNELTPDNVATLDTYAWILYLLGDYSQAYVNMSRALELDDAPSVDVLLHAAAIMEAAGDLEGSKKYLQKALEMGGDLTDIGK